MTVDLFNEVSVKLGIKAQARYGDGRNRWSPTSGVESIPITIHIFYPCKDFRGTTHVKRTRYRKAKVTEPRVGRDGMPVQIL